MRCQQSAPAHTNPAIRCIPEALAAAGGQSCHAAVVAPGRARVMLSLIGYGDDRGLRRDCAFGFYRVPPYEVLLCI